MSRIIWSHWDVLELDIQTKKIAIREKIHSSSPILPPAAFSHQKKLGCFIELFNNVMTIPAPAAASG